MAPRYPNVKQEAPGPPDLDRNFGGSRLLPAQRRFLASTAPYRLFSSGFGSGKSKVGCRESIRYAVTVPGSRHLVARLSYQRLFDSTYVTYRRELREIGFVEGTRGRGHYRENKNEHEIQWFNGSVTLFRNLDDDERFAGLEVNTAFIDEGSECPDSVYRILIPGRLRWHIPSCPHAQGLDPEPPPEACVCPRRAWVCTNPGASGYLRRMFIANQDGDPNRKPRDPDFHWIQASPGENRHNGADYHQRMVRSGEAYGAAWVARYVNGDWNTFEGQRFTMWSDADHLVDAWQPDPESLRDNRYTIAVGVDYGYTNPTFVAFLAVPTRYLTTGELSEPIVCFHEYTRSGAEIEDHATEVVRRLTMLGIDLATVRFGGDPAGRQRTAGSAYSPMHQYAARGINIIPGAKSPYARADLIAHLLSARIHTPSGARAGLLFTTDTPKTAQSVINLRYKTGSSRTGDDPKEVFQKTDDHGFDSLGYALTALGITPPPAGSEPTVRKLPGVSYPATPADLDTTPRHVDVTELNGITI